MSGEQMRAQDAAQHACMLYRLLTDNGAGARERLDHFLRLAHAAFVQDEIIGTAHDTKGVDMDEEYRLALDGAAFDAKRGFVLHALYISPSFVGVFCPRTAARPYLCNPEKISEYFLDPASPFVEIYSQHATGITTLETFIALGTAGWIALKPWEEMAHWRTVSPVAASLEIRLLTGEAMTARERRDATQFTLGAGAADEQRLLEAPPPDSDE